MADGKGRHGKLPRRDSRRRYTQRAMCLLALEKTPAEGCCRDAVEFRPETRISSPQSERRATSLTAFMQMARRRTLAADDKRQHTAVKGIQAARERGVDRMP